MFIGLTTVVSWYLEKDLWGSDTCECCFNSKDPCFTQISVDQIACLDSWLKLVTELSSGLNKLCIDKYLQNCAMI